MNRKNRRRLNLLANAIEEASESLVGWLRAKAERRERRKPLAFETDSQRMMRLISESAFAAMAPKIMEDLLDPTYGKQALMRVSELPGIQFQYEQAMEGVKRSVEMRPVPYVGDDWKAH